MKELLIYYKINYSYVISQIVRHLLLAFYGVLFAAIVGITLGFIIAKNEKLAKVILKIINIIQTIPSLAMLSLVMIVVGLNPNTVVISIFLYSLLPIVLNTYTGVKQVDKDLLDVAKGMGMKKRDIIFKVELPLAISIILGGIRNALVVGIGIASIATFVGAGGLGDIITRGINVSNGAPIIWAGSIPTALMAILADYLLGKLEKKFVVNK